MFYQFLSYQGCLSYQRLRHNVVLKVVSNILRILTGVVLLGGCGKVKIGEVKLNALPLSVHVTANLSSLLLECYCNGAN